MSDIRIALVAEGDTDLVIIEAALKVILHRAFVLTKLQPEQTKPMMGSGWSGVLKWCHATGQRHADSLDTDPTLENFDLVIIHLDIDVSSENYANAGTAVQQAAAANNWADLPCPRPCPPISDTCMALEAVLGSWLNPAHLGGRSVLCLPAQSSGTWLAAATLPNSHPLLSGIECNASVELRLGQLAMNLRIKKTVREYRFHANCIIENWSAVKALCTQADAFERAVRAAV